MIQPIHANATIAVRIRHALNCEQKVGRLGHILYRCDIKERIVGMIETEIAYRGYCCTDKPHNPQDRYSKHLMPDFGHEIVLMAPMYHVHPSESKIRLVCK